MVDAEESAARGANASFEEMTKYLKWECAGILNVKNASTVEDLTEADLQHAYDLGSKL